VRTPRSFLKTKLTIVGFKEDCKTIQNAFFKNFRDDWTDRHSAKIVDIILVYWITGRYFFGNGTV